MLAATGALDDQSDPRVGRGGHDDPLSPIGLRGREVRDDRTDAAESRPRDVQDGRRHAGIVARHRAAAVRDTSSMPLTVREVTGPSALADCGAAFDRLTAVCGSPVTSRRRWLQTWTDCYPDWIPWLLLVEDSDHLVAAAPLARKRSGGVELVVGLGHGPTDDLRLPACDAAAAAALATAIATALRRRPRWYLRVEQLPCPDPVVDALAALLPHVELRSGEGIPTVQIDERDPQRYLSKNTRKALAKIANKLARDGLVPEMTWHQEPEEIHALLPELTAVHRARDEALGRRSDHADPRAAAFYEAVIVRHAEQGEVDLRTLRLRGELAAFLCGFADGPALRSWDNRLSPAWADYSAGRLANTEALVHAVTSDRYDELDWMQGEEPYKLQSATRVVPTTDLYAWSSPGIRRAHAAVERARRAKRDRPHSPGSGGACRRCGNGPVGAGHNDDATLLRWRPTVPASPTATAPTPVRPQRLRPERHRAAEAPAAGRVPAAGPRGIPAGSRRSRATEPVAPHHHRRRPPVRRRRRSSRPARCQRRAPPGAPVLVRQVSSARPCLVGHASSEPAGVLEEGQLVGGLPHTVVRARTGGQGRREVPREAAAALLQSPPQVALEPLVAHAGPGTHRARALAPRDPGPQVRQVHAGGERQGHRAVEPAVQVDEHRRAFNGCEELQLDDAPPAELVEQLGGRLDQRLVDRLGGGPRADACVRGVEPAGPLLHRGAHRPVGSQQQHQRQQLTVDRLLHNRVAAGQPHLLAPQQRGLGGGTTRASIFDVPRCPT